MHTDNLTVRTTDAVLSNPSPFDQIARTDAEGNTYWSARDLMPLMGYRNINAWQPFRANVINRAEKTADNTGMACNFTHVSEVVQREGRGGIERKDVHLDRMAAYLVAMNGDPNKPEVAAAQAYFAMQTRRAELGAGQPPVNPPRPATEAVDSTELAREVGNAVAGAMEPVVSELSTLIERVTRLEHGAEVAAGVRDAKPLAVAKPRRKRKRLTKKDHLTLTQWRREYLPEVPRERLFSFMVNVGALSFEQNESWQDIYGVSHSQNVYKVTELGERHGLRGFYHSVRVVPGREQDLKRFIESMSL